MEKSLTYLLICVFTLAYYANAQTKQQTDSGDAGYDLGVKLFKIGRAEDALPYLQAAVSRNKESYLYRFYAARAAHFSENYQLCVENFTEALRLKPQDQPAQGLYLWRAECNVELGNREEAQRDFNRAVQLQAGLKGAYSTRMFYDTANRCQENAAVKYNEAEVFYQANKIYEAYRGLHVALRCDPKHLPSLKLRLKIEAADNNLSLHASTHRVQLEKLENPNYKTYAAMTTEEKHRLITPNAAALTPTTVPTAMATIVAGKGWDKVIIGASQSEIEAVLGKPEDLIDSASAPNTVSGAYFSKGIVVDYDRKSLRVVGIKFIGDARLYGSGSSAFQSFQGKPDRNLSWGASVAQITGSYGTPVERESHSEFKTNLPIALLAYPGITFILKGDRLLQINITSDGNSNGTTSAAQTVAAPTTTTTSKTTQIKLPVTTPEQDALGKQLFDATQKSDTATALGLIKQGANLNYQTGYQSTLIASIMTRNTELAKILLEAGSIADLPDLESKRTALAWAAQMSNLELVELLINKYKADVNNRSVRGVCVLQTAAYGNKDEKITALLLAAGGNPNVVDEDGESPLDAAISMKKPEIVSLLTKVSNREEIARLKKIQASIPKAPKPIQQTTAVIDPPTPKKEIRDPNADDPDEVSSHRLKSISAAKVNGFDLLDEGTAERQDRNSNDENLGVKQFIAPGNQYQFVMASKDILVVNAIMNGTILNPNCDDCGTSISKYATSYRKSGPDVNGYYLISYQIKLTNFQNNYVTFIPKGNKAGEKIKWLFFGIPASKVK